MRRRGESLFTMGLISVVGFLMFYGKKSTTLITHIKVSRFYSKTPISLFNDYQVSSSIKHPPHYLNTLSTKTSYIFSKSGSTDEEVLLKTAGFTPVEAHLYKLLTDKVLPLIVKDQRDHHREHHSRSRASHADDSANQSSVVETPITTPVAEKKTAKGSPAKTATPRKKAGGATTSAPVQTTAIPAPPQPTPVSEEPPAKKKRSHKKKQPALAPPAAAIDHEEVVATHSEPESTTVDAYMDTVSLFERN
jgi:hypothetical protein